MRGQYNPSCGVHEGDVGRPSVAQLNRTSIQGT